MRESAITLAPEITEQELSGLISAMRAASLAGWHLEIGTAAGGTLRELMRFYSAEKRPRFVVVDPMTYFPDQLAIVRRNLAGAGLDPDTVDFRISKSWPAFRAAERNGEHYSFIFVDGSHKMNRVMQDLSWTRLLEPGGLICFHDYEPRMPGVMRAVDYFLARHRNYEVIGRAERLLLVRKTARSLAPEVSAIDRAWAQVENVYHQLARSLRKRLRGQ